MSINLLLPGRPTGEMEDEAVLSQGGEHKEYADKHPEVNGFHVGNRGSDAPRRGSIMFRNKEQVITIVITII